MGIVGWIILLVVISLIAPELFLMVFLLLYGIGEFILRLFGRSFDDKPKKK